MRIPMTQSKFIDLSLYCFSKAIASVTPAWVISSTIFLKFHMRKVPYAVYRMLMTQDNTYKT